MIALFAVLLVLAAMTLGLIFTGHDRWAGYLGAVAAVVAAIATLTIGQ